MPTTSLINVPNTISTKATSFNFSQEEESRKEVVLLNKDYYYGKQEQTLNLVSDHQDCVTVNLTKPIVKKRATLLYGTPPKREFVGPQNSINFLEQVYKDNKIDFLLQCADLSAELTGSAILHPTEDEDMESGWRLVLFDSSQVSVLQDEDRPEKAEAISIVKVVDRLVQGREDHIERTLKQQVWTQNSVTTWEGNELKVSETNDLDFLPFVNFQAEEVHDQWLGHSPATSIRMLNEDYNQLLTELGFMIKMQAGSIIALEGYPTGEDIIIHPGRALTLPMGASAKVLSNTPRLNDTLNTIGYLEERMYETSGVPKVAVVGGGQASSGRELMIMWFPLVQVFKEKALRWNAYELNLANTILRVAGLPELEDLLVNYSEDAVLPIDRFEDLLAQDVNLGIKTPVDEMKKRHPELDDKEAESKVLANTMFNDILGLSVGGNGEFASPGEDLRQPDLRDFLKANGEMPGSTVEEEEPEEEVEEEE